MKKKILFFSLMAQASSTLFAQSANSRTEINSIMNSWLIPIAGFLLLIGFLALVIQHLDAIRGKNGLSKQDGWFAVGEGMIYVVLSIAAIGIVAAKVAGMSFSI